MQNYISLAARVFLTIIFIKSGIGKLFDPAGTTQAISSVGLPLPGLLTVGAIVFLLAGSLSILLGFKTQWGAWALIAFLIPATLAFHTNFVEERQVIQFLKNLSILGGLLMLVAYGAGALSLDHWLATRSSQRDKTRSEQLSQR